VSQGAGFTQKTLGRVAAHTGALTTGAFGAKQGYEKGGTAGAIVGGVLGAALPEVLSTPTGTMAAARLAQTGLPKYLARGIVASKTPLAEVRHYNGTPYVKQDDGSWKKQD
jgi:hypothetical protein